MLTKRIVLLHDMWPPPCGLYKCFNQALQPGDFRPPSLQSRPGAQDYHLFTKMKVWLATQPFHTNEEFMDGVNNCLYNLVALFLDEGLQKLVLRYDKCVNVDGNYVEK